MGKQVREVQYFFSSQNFSDSLRVTFGIILPALVLAQFDQLELGFIVSTGAFCVSITDMPGPPVHKRNGMLLCCLCIFVVAFITGFARMHPVLMGLEILLFSFFFSMLAVYGNRAAVVGTAALLVMILLMDEPQLASEVPIFSALVLAGGLWYTAFSLLINQLMPYRAVQQALGECVREVARFLSLKSDFYRTNAGLDETYQKLVAQQVLVNEKQEAVREILFKNRLLVKESTDTSRKLLLTFVELVDLFERSMLIHYDYASLRERFGHTGVLEATARAIAALAAELDAVGVAIHANTAYKRKRSLPLLLEELKIAIDAAGEKQKEESTLVLKKILINLRNISQRLQGIQQYFNKHNVPSGTGDLEYGRFVSHQTVDRKTFLDNLSARSAIFKHSFRVAVACVCGFAFTQLLSYGEHSYWVLLTIVVILKPAFSLTKQRNYQRLVGTLIGGVLGFCLLYFIQDQIVLFILMVLLMVGSFSFLRVNYTVFVVLITPLVLIIFNFLGEDNASLLQERFIDTLIGSAIAVAASYLIFPSWESEQLERHLQGMLQANLNYLQKLADRLQGNAVAVADYKLARKEVYVNAANLAAAFQRMLSEPASKQKNSKEVHKFVVLNHILSANIATLSATWQANQQSAYVPDESLRAVRRSMAVLSDALQKLSIPFNIGVEDGEVSAKSIPAVKETSPPHSLDLVDPLLMEQLEFIQRISADIRRTVEAICS